VRPCLRSSRTMSFSSSPVRLPVRTLPSEATARKKYVAAISAVPRSSSQLLGHPHDLFHRGHAGLDLPPAVFAKIAHAVLPRRAGQYARIRVGHDQLADLVVDFHHLEDPHTGGVSASVAVFASHAAEDLYGFALGRNRVAVRLPAGLADDAYQALR